MQGAPESAWKHGALESARKQYAHESTLKQDVNESTLKQDVNESTLKQDVNESTLKQDVNESALKQGTPESAIYELAQLTSKKKLKAYVSRVEGWPGYIQASKALRYIEDGSASPMEAKLTILLTLPYRFGGYGLPMPELNGSIYPRKGMKPFYGRGFYRGDLLWRDAGVVAEYNSDLEHASPDRIAKDAIRRSDLELCGIYEVTVTKRQINNADLFDNTARQIAKRIGRKLRNNDPGFIKKRNELRRVLVF